VSLNAKLSTRISRQMKTPSRMRPWGGYIIAGLLVICICGITWWGRIESARIDSMAVSNEARSAASQLVDRSDQLFNRASQLAQLASQSLDAHPARHFLVDGTENSAVTLVDRNKRVIDSTVYAPGTSLADSPVFARVSAGAGQLQVMRPVALPGNDKLWVPLVRTSQTAEGQFDGAVIIAIRAGYFTETQVLPRRRNTLFALVDGRGQPIAASVDTHTASTPLIRLNDDVWAHLNTTNMTAKDLPVLRNVFGSGDHFVLLSSAKTKGLKALVAVPFATASSNTQKLFEVVYVVVGLICLSVLGVAAVIQRQTARLQASVAIQFAAKNAVRKEREFFALTLGSIEDGVMTLDATGLVTYCNRRAEMLTGWSSAEAVGHARSEVAPLHVPADSSGKEYRDIQLAASVPGAAQLVSRSGVITPVEYSVTALDQPHEGTSYVLVLRDVSEAAQMANTLSYQASHDALTGLLNRTAFNGKVDSAIEAAQRDDSSHVLLFLDLDQFKVVNDSCGHAAGDELLKQVSFLFAQVLRKGDTLARTGGDEFAVLLENCPVSVAVALSDKLRRQLDTFRFAWQDKSFQVGVSIGAVEVNAVSGSRGEVMRKADTACYVAKDAGRGRTHLYLDSDEAVMLRQGELNWATRLQHALEHGEFELHGQRIVSPGNDDTHYYEMLVRLREADGRLVPPMAFLPAAERYGLMPALDKTVIVRALQMHGEMQAASRKPVKFAINLSGASLSDPKLLDFIRDAMSKHKVAPHLICFEITETVAIGNLQVAVRLMSELKSLGCTLSLDDFGSGMSSFSYLKQLPVDVVKIDGSFVRNMLVNPVDYAMVEAVNNIAHQMGLKTLAEYVESPELIAALSEMGVDMLQGYGVGIPEALPAMLAGVAQAAPVALRAPKAPRQACQIITRSSSARKTR
jgi:diguanylate cyclase (GGDEF)-like protein/PAS domain S-box-containing protein